MKQLKLINLITIISLILLIFPSNSITWRPWFGKRSSLSILQYNLCVHGGGLINNSTAIELGNCFNDFYYVGLNLGTGSQYFNLVFDTGSPTLWIPLGTNPSGFNQAASSTYSITSQANSIMYGQGTGVSGYMGNDIVSVGQTPISINGSILFASNSNTTFPGTSIYGLVGMDFASYPNFLDVAYQNGQISTPVFSLDLNYLNQTSYMYYNNGLSQEKRTKTVWAPAISNQYWMLQVIGMSVNGVDMTSTASDTVIIDSGTSQIVLNVNLHNSIIQQFFSTSQCTQDNQGYTFCSCNGAWPQMSFMFLGVEVYIPGNAYKIPVGNGVCQVGLVKSADASFIILGDFLFREYTISFDRINKRVGFYGNTTPVNIFDPQYFVILQYIICGLSIIFSFTGIALWLYGNSRLEKMSEKRQGAQINLKQTEKRKQEKSTHEFIVKENIPK